MIEIYFTKLEQILQAFPNIQSYTLQKKIYNSKHGYIHGAVMFEIASRLDFVEVKQADKQAKIKYRYHYMDANQALIFRYDNAPHHPNLSTFPHHKHLQTGEQDSEEPTLEDVLLEIAQRERQQGA